MLASRNGALRAIEIIDVHATTIERRTQRCGMHRVVSRKRRVKLHALRRNAVTDLNPQGRQMADESMVRNLAAQADAIWPQEAPLFDRYTLPAQARILDAGCGTGEISRRLAERFVDAHVLGIDIIDAHLDLARSRYTA